jgi:Flp pilus assembly protein TadG
VIALGDSERGSAAAEFAMVGALLTILTLTVLQLGLALHVRNTVTDAASEGARQAALAGSSLDAGVNRAADLISTALGPAYASDISATVTEVRGVEATVVTIRTRLPLIGLIGLEEALEVQGHAALESLPE